MKQLARRAYKHMYGGWIEIARFQFNYMIYIYKESAVFKKIEFS